MTILIAALVAIAGAPQTSAPARRSIAIVRVEQAPQLDDYLNGEVPAGTRVDEFLQRQPGDLTPSTESTTAYLSYDRENLYVAFVCRAKDTSRIRAHMARRESIFNDDSVRLFLDTFNDKQRTYMFFVTPLGIQADGISTEGQLDDLSFDAVWHSDAKLTDFGYVALIAVPFKSLRFPSGEGPQTWGLALARYIPAADEIAFWPGITQRISGFASQMADATGLNDVSAGRNIQVTPYGSFAAARLLDPDVGGRRNDGEGRLGLDAKVVVRDAVTIDLTVNPDFSQVESDEPQVTANQRFEVFFPERRPFFLENAGYFQTAFNLFFSRRVRDPGAGLRATGKIGDWALGAIALNDRAPGQALAPADPFHGETAWNFAGRVRREFGESSVGVIATSRDFATSSNRVAALDGRLKLNLRWFLDGQVAVSDTRTLDGQELRDSAIAASLTRSGRAFTYYISYQDVGPDFRTQLGFIPQVDMRQVFQFATYRWRPAQGPIRAFGPNQYVHATWSHDGTMQDWLVRFPFQIDFKRQTFLFVRHAQAMTRVRGIELRDHENFGSLSSAFFPWMTLNVTYGRGTRPNFAAPAGVMPFLGDYQDASVSVTLRPVSNLRLDQTYIISSFGRRSPSGRLRVFDNHILRTRASYQFTRRLSARAILDYNGTWPDQSLVALTADRRLAGDLLVTYLVNPGTAVYVGYTDRYENVLFERDGGLRTIARPDTSVGRQLFVKTSYLLRF